MTNPTNDDLEKMEKDPITFYEISCGVPPNNFDIIMNCKSSKEIWEVVKILYEGTEHAQDKNLTTALNEFTNFKALLSENLDESLKRLNITITRLSNVGTVRSNRETNIQFLNGLGRQWTTIKMIVQGDNKIKTMSVYKLYGELQA